VRETILIVEDEKLIRMTLRDRLEAEGFAVREATRGEEGVREVEAGDDVDLALLDYKLPDVNGIEVFRRIQALRPDVPVILMTAYSSVEKAVEAMRLGAYNYLTKPFTMDEMVVNVTKALETTRLRREVKRFVAENRERWGLGRIVGSAPAIVEVFELVKKIARSGSSTVLVLGESGTGKDLIAKAIHFESDRAPAPFMNVTCSALPEQLLESELFGHERGAFTDAKAEKKGLMELSRGGTVFLDEVGEMPVSVQAKLLRFLEERTFKRVGGVRDITVDVRIIAATNKDLERAVEAGQFRSDLYYRLNVIPIRIPPLRERREDVPALVAFFIDQMNREFRRDVRGATPEALEALQRYAWPGNVRELRNVVERAMILGGGDRIALEDLSPEVRGARAGGAAAGAGAAAAGGAGAASPGGGAAAGASAAGGARIFHLPGDGVDFDALERDLVRQALEAAGGNQTQAARLLKMTRDQIRYRIEKFGLG
jgi:DNA-binding NtrC family response regulator